MDAERVLMYLRWTDLVVTVQRRYIRNGTNNTKRGKGKEKGKGAGLASREGKEQGGRQRTLITGRVIAEGKEGKVASLVN